MNIKSTTTLRKICELIQDNIDDVHPVFAIVGGQACSKTFSVLMLLINRAMQWKPDMTLPNGEPDRGDYYVASAELSKLRNTAIKDFKYIMQEFGIYKDENFKAETDYIFDSGAHIKFLGIDKSDMSKGLRSSILMIDEANKITYESYRQISSRAGIVLLCWNADYESYIETMVIPDSHTHFLRVNYLDNECCPANEIAEIESYKEKGYNEDGTVKNEFFANLYQVFGLGMTGRAIGAVYQNWTIGEYQELDLNGFGLDFGYSSDPDALIRVSIDNKRKIIYMKEELYQNGNSEDDLGKILKMKCSGHVIVADSAEDRLIADLKNKFKLRILPVHKPRVVESIKKLQGYNFIVDPDSLNLQRELQTYIWKEGSDKTIPIDKFNHLLDCLRYVAEYLTVAQPKPSSVVVTGNRRRSGGPVVSRLY